MCVYIHIRLYILDCYLAIKENQIMPFAATSVDLDIIILSEVSQTEKPNVTRYNLCVESKKMIQINLFTKQTHNHRKQIYDC